MVRKENRLNFRHSKLTGGNMNGPDWLEKLIGVYADDSEFLKIMLQQEIEENKYLSVFVKCYRRQLKKLRKENKFLKQEIAKLNYSLYISGSIAKKQKYKYLAGYITNKK